MKQLGLPLGAKFKSQARDLKSCSGKVRKDLESCWKKIYLSRGVGSLWLKAQTLVNQMLLIVNWRIICYEISHWFVCLSFLVWWSEFRLFECQISIIDDPTVRVSNEWLNDFKVVWKSNQHYWWSYYSFEWPSFFRFALLMILLLILLIINFWFYCQQVAFSWILIRDYNKIQIAREKNHTNCRFWIWQT